MDKILVVDSDSDTVKSISEGLAKSGRIGFLIASDSKKAVSILNNNDISVLVSGLNLPDFDGIELIAYMTRTFPATPCIAMLEPENPRPWFIDHDNHQDVLEFIEKPIGFEGLISLVNTCLQRKNKGFTQKGMTLKNFLPLIETFKRSCKMEARDEKKNKGSMFFFRGRLVDARCENKIGDAAIAAMLEWDTVKISISRLPGNIKEARISIPLMEKIGVSWERRDDTTTIPSITTSIETITPLTVPEAPPADPAIISRLDSSLKKYVQILKSIKGYLGLAVLDANGQVLASDFAQAPIDFNKFSGDFTAILNQCTFAAGRQGFQRCTGCTVHTEKGIIIMIPAEGYRFIGLMSPEGNGFFMQVQLGKIIPQILRQ